MRTRATIAALSVLTLLNVPSTAEAAELRDVLLVGNAKAGTVSFLDGRTFENLGTFNAIPDLRERLDAMNPVERIGYETVNQIQGYKKFVDDLAMSPDGKTLYLSRGNLSDAVAFDVASGRQLWRRKVEGFKADHVALSPDGRRFVVSATTAGRSEVINTADGTLAATFPTGAYPHANDYSPDGSRLYNSSIGVTSFPKALNFMKGARQVTVVDPATFKVTRVHEFEYGIRPAVFTKDNRTMFAQLSYLNGFVEYDLDAGKITRTVQMPFSDRAKGMTTEQYPQNSAHHGMAINADESRLCMAGTIDDYVAIVSRPGLTTDGFVHYATDSLPYWAASSQDGRYCLVSLSNKNQISVVDYRTAKEVKRVTVGEFPQRERLGKVTGDVIDSLS